MTLSRLRPDELLENDSAMAVVIYTDKTLIASQVRMLIGSAFLAVAVRSELRPATQSNFALANTGVLSNRRASSRTSANPPS